MKKISSILRYVVLEDTQDEALLNSLERRNPNGEIIEEVYYYRDGSIEQKTERVYDEQNHLVEERQYSTEEQPDQITRTTFGEHDRPLSREIQYRSGGISKTAFNYSPDFKTVSIETRDENGNWEEKIVQELDNENRVVAETRYDENGKVLLTQALSYNEDARLLSRIVDSQEEGKRQEFFEYFFDEEGRLTEVEMFDEKEEVYRADEVTYTPNGERATHKIEDFREGSILEENWEYDDENRVIKNWKKQGNGILVESKEYQYNEEGFIAQIEILRPGEQRLDLFKYEFFED